MHGYILAFCTEINVEKSKVRATVTTCQGDFYQMLLVNEVALAFFFFFLSKISLKM